MLLKEIQNTQFFSTYEETENWLLQKKINNYIIDSNTLEVTVQGDVDLSWKNIDSIPIKFKYVKGDFNCEYNQLTSLQGSPDRVEHNCWYHGNKLTSLQGAPKYVGGAFTCGRNQLTTLQGAPEYIGGLFFCSGNNLTSLQGCPPHLNEGLICTSSPSLIATITKFIKSSPIITLLRFPHNEISFMWAFRIKSLKRIDIYDASDEQNRVIAIVNKHLSGDGSGPACQIELIDAGLGKYIKL